MLSLDSDLSFQPARKSISSPDSTLTPRASALFFPIQDSRIQTPVIVEPRDLSPATIQFIFPLDFEIPREWIFKLSSGPERELPACVTLCSTLRSTPLTQHLHLVTGRIIAFNDGSDFYPGNLVDSVPWLSAKALQALQSRAA